MALNENIMIRLSADTSNYSTRMAAASTQAEKLSTALEKPGSKSRIATNLMAGMGLAPSHWACQPRSWPPTSTRA